MEKLCEGPHVHADFQPARFVPRLQGILLPNTGRDGSVANFCFNSIFEFFNKIPPIATVLLCHGLSDPAGRITAR